MCDSELIENDPCHSRTVETRKPQTRPVAPPSKTNASARATAGSSITALWLRKRSSGNLFRSANSALVVWSQSEPRIQPMCECQNPLRRTEWMSWGASENLRWWRWWLPHHTTPFCADDCAPSASRNWNARDVLNARCEKYRWYAAVTSTMRTQALAIASSTPFHEKNAIAPPTAARWMPQNAAELGLKLR